MPGTVSLRLTPLRAVYVPVGHRLARPDAVEVVAHRPLPYGAHGQRRAAHPNILLVDAVGQPEIAAGRCLLALGDAPHVAGAEVFVLAHEAAGRHLAVNHADGVVNDAVAARHHGERIAVGLCLYRIEGQGIAAVGGTLAPLLATGHDERRTAHGRRPTQSLVR